GDHLVQPHHHIFSVADRGDLAILHQRLPILVDRLDQPDHAVAYTGNDLSRWEVIFNDLLERGIVREVPHGGGTAYHEQTDVVVGLHGVETLRVGQRSGGPLIPHEAPARRTDPVVLETHGIERGRSSFG